MKTSFHPGWIEDVIFSIETFNRCVEEYMNSRKEDSNFSVGGNSVSSWIRECEKENLQLKRQDENETQHENLSDLANKLNELTIKSTELEPHKERRDSEHQKKKPCPSLNEEDGINQSQIKEKLIEFSNQSHRHHSDIDTTAVEQSQKMNEINQYPQVSFTKMYGRIDKQLFARIQKENRTTAKF